MSDEQGSSNDSKRAVGAFEPLARNSPPPVSGRPTWAEIDLDNLVHNFLLIRSVVGDGVAIMPAVKADAYGHGAVDCARALEKAGADWFGVALPEEGVKLREAGISCPILCLGGFWTGQEQLLLQHSLTPGVSRLAQLESLNRAAESAGRIIDYHLKIDTGMGRLGVPCAELEDFLDTARRFRSLRMDGVWTHLASADLPEQRAFTLIQTKLFQEAIVRVRSKGFQPRWLHEANGAAAHSFAPSRESPMNLVRPGGVIYGLWRDVTDPSIDPLDWRPVLSLHTQITHMKRVGAGTQLGYGGTYVTTRPSTIATLPIGYEDGLRRAESNRGRVLVGGQQVPIVGRVSMDLTLIDVTEVDGAAIGDRVVVIGRQGGFEIRAEEIAAEIGTISYEVTCGISDRVPRVYRRLG